MPLTLHPNPASAPVRRKTDHLVMNGQLEVGRIYKRDAPFRSEPQWLWAINGVQLAAPGVMRVAGIAPSFEQAKAELQGNWDKWLAWANLQEIGGGALEPASVASDETGNSVHLQPGSTPVAADEAGGSVPLQPESTPVAADEAGGSVPLQPESTPVAADEAGGSVPLQPESTPVAADEASGS